LVRAKESRISGVDAIENDLIMQDILVDVNYMGEVGLAWSPYSALL